MDWLKVCVHTSSQGIEPVTGRLYRLGVTGVEIEDFEDFKDFLENNRQYWDYVDDDLIESKKGETKVITYVSNDENGRTLLRDIEGSVKELKEDDTEGVFGKLMITVSKTADADWANNWKKYFHRLEVGDKVLIKPVWEEYTEKTDRIIFNINPGMSFGTGSHSTTSLCIEELERYVKPGINMLDLGCGSGILSVISLMLGAGEAWAVDIDPNAVDTAYENAALNNIGKDRYHVFAGDVTSDGELDAELSKRGYEVAAANIVADVIIAVLPAVKRYMCQNGVFIASGIIAEREQDVRAALNKMGFGIINTKKHKDWICLVCRISG